CTSTRQRWPPIHAARRPLPPTLSATLPFECARAIGSPSLCSRQLECPQCLVHRRASFTGLQVLVQSQCTRPIASLASLLCSECSCIHLFASAAPEHVRFSSLVIRKLKLLKL